MDSAALGGQERARGDGQAAASVISVILPHYHESLRSMRNAEELFPQETSSSRGLLTGTFWNTPLQRSGMNLVNSLRILD